MFLSIRCLFLGLHPVCHNFGGLCTSLIGVTTTLITYELASRFTISTGSVGRLYDFRYASAILSLVDGVTNLRWSTGLMLVTSMFYTRTEIGERIGWYQPDVELAIMVTHAE